MIGCWRSSSSRRWLSISRTASTTRETRWPPPSPPAPCRRASRSRSPGSLNLVGAFLSFSVAATIASGLVATGAVTLTVVFAGLVGGITWNVATWYLGIPSSSSHALIGGVVGSTIAAAGFHAIKWHGIVSKVILPAVLSPVIAIFIAAVGTASLFRLSRGFAEGARPRLPDRPDRLRVDGLAGSRHQRRAEDDGRHHAGADRPWLARGRRTRRRPG